MTVVNLGNTSLTIAQLKNAHLEADVLSALREYFFFGHKSFSAEARVDDNLEWVRELLFGRQGFICLTVRYHNMYLAWPIYPNEKTLRKPVGPPYRDRIKKSFATLQQMIDWYFWFLNDVLDKLVIDDDWSIRIEEAIDLICTAYQDPIKDQFDLRSDCTIIRPDKYIVQEVRSDMIRFKKGENI